MERPTVDEVRRALRYEPDTGKLFWRWRDDIANHVNRRFAGKEAFTAVSGGYRIGGFKGKVYTAQTMVWVIQNGEWPAGKIWRSSDDKSDNRVENLRDSVRGGGRKVGSMSSKQKNNKSGYVGVCFIETLGKWTAYVSKGGKQIRLGYFDQIEDAIAARKAAE